MYWICYNLNFFGDIFLVAARIVLFLLVEKIVRCVEENSKGANAWNHTPHHHHHKNSKKLKDDNDDDDKIQQQPLNEKNECISEISSQGKVLDGVSEKQNQPESLRKKLYRDAMAISILMDVILVTGKRKTSSGAGEDNISDAPNGSTDHIKSVVQKGPSHSPSNLVFGYLNLFSDGVHNFTDGMALGSAFLLYGSVGGWSRTLFLLAHELPQEALEGCKHARA
ncbi:unnamed protein product [Camellia sinensis]